MGYPISLSAKATIFFATSWRNTEHAAVGSTLLPGPSTSASTNPTEVVGLMVYEMLVGLHVTNDEMYQTYREKMTPVLVECGGGFGYDFRIAEVLKSQADHEINRVFTIYFPDKEAMRQFFSAESYKAIKAEFFEPSVASRTLIAEYNRET